MMNCGFSRWAGQRWGLGVVGAIALALIHTTPGKAQSLIVPDDTLGAEQSQVIPNFNGLPIELITGGAQREQNLFHSFEEFNVDDGRGAFFFSPAGLENIFSRVTGNNPSNILGVLGTVGESAPDLYFMNPNGIIFGPNSSLAVGGSFVATTADSIQFDEQGFFSTIDPELPSQLLTVNPSAFLFSQIQPGDIINTSITPVGLNATGVPALGLRVPDGESLILLGGNVTLDGSQSLLPGGGGLRAFGGRIELGGVSGVGIIELLREEDNNLSLVFPQDVERADISVVNGATVEVIGGGRGDISINGRNVDILRGSGLSAGIGPGLGGVGTRAGDLRIDATGDFTLSDSSTIGNFVVGGIGSSGNIEIASESVNILNGSAVGAASVGQGNAGDVTIQARDTINILGRGANGNASGILSTVASFEQFGFPTFLGVGDGGDITLSARQITLSDSAQVGTTTLLAPANAGDVIIVTDVLEVLNGALLSATTSGAGNAGNIIINAANHVTFSGTSADGMSTSGANSSVLATTFGEIPVRATGDGGNIEITTPILEVLNGAILSASTLGEGDAGSVIIEASDRVTFAGSSSARSTVEAGGRGTGGNIEITVPILRVQDGAQLQASTRGNGDAGSVIITASDRVLFSGTSADVTFPSGAFSTVEAGGVGTGGNIEITAPILRVQDGARLSASTFGEGDAGSVVITASDRVLFSGALAFSRVESGGRGTGGNIEITAPILRVLDGAQLLASTRGNGDAGSVIIEANDRVLFSGTSADGEFRSAAFSAIEAGGRGTGGNIEITAPILRVLDGARLVASTFGEGDAGSVIIVASDRVTFSEASGDGTLLSGAVSQVESGGRGTGGNIEITAPILRVLDGAQLSASTFGEGDAGSVIIEASDRVQFSGTSADVSFPSGAFSRVEAGGRGTGGNIEITAPILRVLDGARLSTDTRDNGDAGNVIITVSDRVTFAEGSAAFSSVEAGGRGTGGNIEITAPILRVLGGAQLLANTRGNGDAGSVVIEASDRVLFSGTAADVTFPSGAFSRVEDGGRGTGGNIEITTPILRVLDGARLSADTRNNGDAGNVIIAASDRVTFAEGSAAFSAVEARGRGTGGNIEITAPILRVLGGAQLLASTRGNGDAGSVIIAASDSVLFSGTSADVEFRSAAFSAVEAGGRGTGGNIEITTPILRVLDGAGLSASTFGEGNAGSVIIEASDRILFSGTSADGRFISGASSAVADEGVGSGGNVEIATTTLRVQDRASLNARTEGQGNSGQVTITASDRISLLGNSQITTAVGRNAEGNSQAITLQTPQLILRDNSQILATTAGNGNAGSINISEADIIRLNNSRISTAINRNGIASRPSNITIDTRSLQLNNDASITASTAGQGRAGDIFITNAEAVALFNGEIASEVRPAGQGRGGTLNIQTDSLDLTNRSNITASTAGRGRAGNIFITAVDVEGDRASRIRTSTSGNQNAGNITVITSNSVSLDGSNTGIFANTESDSRGDGGNIAVHTQHLNLTDRAEISSESLGEGIAGSVEIQADQKLRLANGRIATSATQAAGGAIEILAGDFTLSGTSDITTNVASGVDSGGNIDIVAAAIRLRDDSDITTNVSGGTGDGGNIAIAADSIIAFDDSDIISSAPQGRGGNVTLDTSAFFGEGFSLDALEADPEGLDGNDRADINATGAVAGTVALPDVSFIQNSLNDLPESLINTDELIANSCVVRNADGSSSFVITGAEGLPNRPGELVPSDFPTGEVQSVPEESSEGDRPWQIGDPIVEPQGVYQLPNGELILSHACQ